jgi:hypothetical protein
VSLGPNGTLLGKPRTRMLTGFERTVGGLGDGSTLDTYGHPKVGSRHRQR